jgi:leader peptidase (prepilin peptidase) / N-methyltransferase
MDYIFIIFIGIIALFFGSFANVVVYRLKNGGNICYGRSQCRDCKHVLSVFDLIPIFSWVFLRGKCRYCRSSISVQYPLVEMLFSIFWIMAAAFLGMPENFLELAYLFFVFFLISMLITLSVYDFLYYEIPDGLSFPMIGISLLSLFLTETPGWKDAFFGVVLVYSFFYIQILIPSFFYAFQKKKWKIFFHSILFYILFPLWIFLSLFLPQRIIEKISVFKDEDSEEEIPSWIGGGDLRLAFVMGIVLGLKLSVVALFISYILGSIISIALISLKIKSRKEMIPFGPFLSLGTFIAFFFGEYLWTMYWAFVL